MSGAEPMAKPINPLVADLEAISVQSTLLRDALEALASEVDRAALFATDSHNRCRAWADKLDRAIDRVEDIYISLDSIEAQLAESAQ